MDKPPAYVAQSVARIDRRLQARAIRLSKALAAHELAVASSLQVEIDTLLDWRLEAAR